MSGRVQPDPVARTVPYRVLTTGTLRAACVTHPQLWEDVVGPWLQWLTDKRHLFLAPPLTDRETGLVDVLRTRWMTEFSGPEIQYTVAADRTGFTPALTVAGNPMTAWSDCPVNVPQALLALRTPWRPGL